MDTADPSESDKLFVTLGIAECKQLLEQCDVGRVAVVVDGQPHIVPVNYAWDGEAIVFRTAVGTVLTEVSLRRAAFEIDGVDEAGERGWSVVVHGMGHDITDTIDEESRRLRGLSFRTWPPGERGQWFEIEAAEITGRRIA